jgi:hypothetical protein
MLTRARHIKPDVLLFAIAAIGLFYFGCGDGDFSTDSGPVTYTYQQFVHFDSTEYRFVKRDDPRALTKIPEPLVNWEKSLGEPFTDVNGNGVYEPGIDSFVISSDPSINQDLNHNDQYDNPEDPWTEGIPFDDIDGNGQFRPDPGEHISGYELGLPYCDYNENQKHDGDLKARYGVAKWKSGLYYIDGIKYSLAKCDSAAYRFVSDSDQVYDLLMSYAPTMNALIYTDTGLDYKIPNFALRLLNPGTIVEEDSTRIELPWYPDPVVYYRWVTLAEHLEVDGISFSGLVKVRVGDDNFRYDFYFSRDWGILAYELWEDNTTPPNNWVTFTRTIEYYFRRFDAGHSLIFPMTR